MAKKDFTLSSKILMSLLAAGDMLLVSPKELNRRLRSGQILGNNHSAAAISYYLARKGLIKFIDKNNERFIKLTQKGQLEALLAKARLPESHATWDGKWRLIIFDIPEDSNQKRDFFRTLLKKNGFIFLQASVYISPYPLNRAAIMYLKETKLIDYIRILKIEEMDNDRELRKKFNLSIKV